MTAGIISLSYKATLQGLCPLRAVILHMDDIIELKPGIGPVRINVRALLRSMARDKVNRQSTAVAQRFVQLFEAHGVAVNQIQHFLPEITLDKIKCRDSLLGSLTHEVLDRAAQLFRVRRCWLDGVDDQVYECRSCYKAPERFFQDLEEWTDCNSPDVPVRAICSRRSLDFSSSRPQPLVIVLVHKLRELGDLDIERYCVYTDGLDWSHAGCRIQIKAMIRIINERLHRPVPLYVARSKQIEQLNRGELVPRNLLRGPFLTEPSLEDYSMASDESAVAKECEELPDVLEYISVRGLEWFRTPQQMGM